MRVSEIRDERGRSLTFRNRVIEFLDHPTWQVHQLIVALPRPLATCDSVTIAVAYGGYMLGYSETGWEYLHDRIDSTYTLLRMDTYAEAMEGGQDEISKLERRGYTREHSSSLCRGDGGTTPNCRIISCGRGSDIQRRRIGGIGAMNQPRTLSAGVLIRRAARSSGRREMRAMPATRLRRSRSTWPRHSQGA